MISQDVPPKCVFALTFQQSVKKHRATFQSFFFFSFLLVFGIETSNRKKKNNYMNLREVNKSVAVFAARPLSSCLSHI